MSSEPGAGHDQIQEMRAHIERFEKSGFDVTVAPTTDEAKQMLQSKHFDVAIVDLLMPQEFGHSLIEEIRERHPETKTAVMSGYLGTKELCDRAFFRDHRIPVFDKDEMPSPATAEYGSEVIEPVRVLARKGETTINVWGARAMNQSSVLTMTFEEYSQKSKMEKILLKRLAREKLFDTINAVFGKGAIWVLVLGDSQEIHSANQMAGIWPWSKIRAKCEATNVVPFQYFNDIEIDDFGWGSACNGDLKNYPTVILASLASRKVWQAIHFDTGCPITLVESNAGFRLSQIEVDREEPIELPMRGNTLVSYRYTLQCYLIDRRSSKKITIEGFAVDADDWYEGPLKRACNARCERLPNPIAQGRNGICQYRWGLVGRNLLTEVKLKLILDGNEGSSKIG